MPDENVIATDVLNALDVLEDNALDAGLNRNQHYEDLKSALEKDLYVDVKVIKRILAVCEHDLKEHMKFAAVIMSVLPIILSRIKRGTYDPPPDLVPAALAVMNIIKTTALLNKVETLKVLCYETLLAFPEAALISVTEHHTEVLDIFNLYCHLAMPIEVRLQAYSFLFKLLKILPPEKKRNFVGKGLPVWFSKILPSALAHLVIAGSDRLMAMEIMELLADDLVHFNYNDDPNWQTTLQCICDTERYPLLMRSLLQQGSDIWHRIWIVLIKLLKHQITQSFGNIGTPINSMLPVVEAAFKVDITNRCRAFECWNVLIDSFSTETNESNISKRLKLLVIPLKSNNAKAEETALAKFNCWWHLIVKFQSKMDRFLDMILVSFLQFLFGRHNCTDKTVMVPGQITTNVKRQTVKAIVDIVGHVDCQGCTNLPKLKGKLINTKHLVDNWNHWIYSLTSSIMLAANNDDMLTNQQIKCLWMSFVLTIGALPDNYVRKDLFYEILAILKHMFQESIHNRKLAEIAFNVLLMSLFDGNPTINILLKTKNGDNNPMNETLNILQEPAMNDFYQSFEKRVLVSKLKHVTKLVVDKHFNPTHVVARFLMDLPGTDTALLLWTAMAESIHENERMCAKNLLNMLLWPLKFMDSFSDIKLAAMAWYKLYDSVLPKLCKTDIENEIKKILLAPRKYTEATSYFTLCSVLGVLKYKLLNGQLYNRELELLKSLTNDIKSYKDIDQVYSILVDRLMLILHNLTKIKNETLAGHAVHCFKNLLNITTLELKAHNNDKHMLTLFGNAIESLDKLFNIEMYSQLASIVADDLIKDSTLLCENVSIKCITLKLLKTIMNMINDETISKKIQDVIRNTKNTEVEVIDLNKNEDEDNVITVEDNDNQNISEDKGKELDNNNFNPPNITEVPKKSKTKVPSIVNTVVDDGVEYVVVKSNWKFNPRKLTENQKEKFKRKREDIPALYQDLSQSQDEFQLTPWKADSQDTSSSRSESKSNAATNEDAATILKNMPSSNVVPNILGNILTKEKNDNTSSIQDSSPKSVHNRVATANLKHTKSPRLALKDRVFRNVRNLIEKSSIQKEAKDTDEQLTKSQFNLQLSTPAKIDVENDKTEINLKTPTSTKTNSHDIIVNSAPTLLSADRPSRVKRKPKKFDDLELLALKKSRHSMQGTQSNAKTIETIADIHPIKKVVSKNIKDINTVTDNVTDNSAVLKNQDMPQHFVAANVSENRLDNTINGANNKNAEENTVEKSNEVVDVTTSRDNNLNEDNNTEISDEMVDTSMQDVQQISTPIQPKANDIVEQKSTAKKSSKKSRIEKELAIDMVEGHPYLTMQSERRLTRKSIATTPLNSGKRKGLAEKNKSKLESNTTPRSDNKKNKEVKEIENIDTSFVVNESQENSDTSKTSADELQSSEDIIESSQDSTFSTLSVKSTKKSAKKVPVVTIEKLKPLVINNDSLNVSQSILDCGAPIGPNSKAHDNNDDSELPLNKTVIQEKSSADLTENMDTEPLNENEITDDVIIIDDDVPAPITVSSEDSVVVGQETQEIAEADTLPVDPSQLMAVTESQEKPSGDITAGETSKETDASENITTNDVENAQINTQNNVTATLSESVCAELENNEVSSPFKDDVQRKQDFLDNTLEISPIKTMSPDRDKKSPSPETSSDYVVIKLTSPVQSNGEPFEKCGSPEFFTNDKVSPDKRDQSPPRVEVSVTNTSPSSSLSLKKNRPQVRPGGRAAQMLGLCVPDKLHAIINPERNEPEEAKKCSPSNSAARRNLRIMYNTAQNDNTENVSEKEDVESFLKFRRSLPAVDSSPSCPILKRKLGEIMDEATVSPASKRKRVSFQDPPVSTTISVQKYIEPIGLRSPQNSVQKRLERQLRQLTPVKSPKRLDTVFKLDSALTKTVESFTEEGSQPADDTQPSSLDETPAVEVVKASELNDTDPICPELLECNDPIDNVAGELSSPAMKSLLIKELEGKVETVGDLAKMTELEVNRLCIKAPKVKIVKKVLSDYVAKKSDRVLDVTVAIDAAMFDETMNEPASKLADIEIQTDYDVKDMEVQTTSVAMTVGSIQTEVVSTAHLYVQTDETGDGSTADIIKLCLLKKPDFVEELGKQLQESHIHQMTEKLPINAVTDLLMKKVTRTNSDTIMNRLLDQQTIDAPVEQRKTMELSVLSDFICGRFDSKDLILFCSQVLQKVHDKPA